MPVSSSFDDPSARTEGAIKAATQPGDALPPSVLTVDSGPWILSGSGVFSWSVFRLYRASLFVQDSLDSGKPFALMLSYLRRVTALQIADTSSGEFARLGFGCEQDRARWHAQMIGLLPDVGLGDTLVGLFVPEQRVTFFDAGHCLGSMEDPLFVKAFASIWLDPRTQGPALRKALLGNKDG